MRIPLSAILQCIRSASFCTQKKTSGGRPLVFQKEVLLWKQNLLCEMHIGDFNLVVRLGIYVCVHDRLRLDLLHLVRVLL